MKTLQEVRDRFEKLLKAHASPLEQIDAVLAEDGTTVLFYAYLQDENEDDKDLVAGLAITREAARQFDPRKYVRELTALRASRHLSVVR